MLYGGVDTAFLFVIFLLGMALCTIWLCQWWIHRHRRIGNLFGCLWFYTAALTPITSADYPVTWLQMSGLGSDSFYTQWVTSMYWAFTTLTTTGYGDIAANTNPERSLVIIATLIGVTLNAIIIGQVSVDMSVSALQYGVCHRWAFL